ncbi:FAD-dependent oxidoreductase [soil metagenome]
MLKVAVIGAGVSGAACAAELTASGYTVTVFDKGRQHGGRLASRVTDDEQFDYGAQYFTARGAEFKTALAGWIDKGWVKPWIGHFGKFANHVMQAHYPQNVRYVAVPSMHSLAQYMLREVDVSLASQVTRLSRDEATRLWSVTGRVNIGSTTQAETEFEVNNFNIVVVSLPPVQANALAANTQVAAVKLDPCWAVMAAFANPLAVQIDGATIENNALSWIARDSSKPNRPPGERWILHGAPDWSAQNIEATEREIIEKLLTDFFALVNLSKIDTTFIRAHRWRYARATTALSDNFIFDESKGLGYCGDWCTGDRIESAYQSGVAMARRISSIAQQSR